VEHIDFEELTSVVIESLRVLKPGGLMVLETPNPENIGVATSNFYLDPTHRRPIPPQLLSFLAGHYGFPRVKVLRLQEAAALRTETRPTLRDVIHGVSPDYAVIAQKAASPEEMQLFDTAFNREYGLPLDTLLQRFDERLTRAEQPEILRQRLRQSLPWRAMLVVRDRINRLLNQ
jgi:O-antigen chain-terminating methyltransferase